MRLYTKRPNSAAEFAKMRGVTDFSNAAQFNLYETGYAYLVILSRPEYLEKLKAEQVPSVGALLDTFCHILEYEFKGLSGIDDITVDSLEVSDGISTLNVIGKVNKQSASEISMTFTEKSGSVITNFIRYYIEGIKDPRTQAKTYHGLIKAGKMAGGFENEVFNFLYIVTDNTMLQVEKAYLLCNAWPTKASTSIYNNEKGNIEKQDVELTWQCFVIDDADVDLQAAKVLSYLNEPYSVYNAYNAMAPTEKAIPVTLEDAKKTTDKSEIIHLEHDGSDYVMAEGSSTYTKHSNEVGSRKDGFNYYILDENKQNLVGNYINKNKS